MRYIATRSIALLLICTGTLEAQLPALFSDPVFGMTYDTRAVHFQNAPRRISQLCPDLRAQRFWLYAYWKTGDSEYFVLSNLKSEDSGVGVVLRGSQCVEGLPDWLLSGDKKYHPASDDKLVVFTQATLQGLASDLLRRYANAFGGKKNFLEAVKKKGLPPQDLVPVLRAEFERFSNTQ